MQKVPLLATILLFGTSLVASACPRENENFLVPEYHGQENAFVGHIDTKRSIVESNHVDFFISEVHLNGALVCGGSARGAKRCERTVVLGDRELGNRDHVRVVMKTLFPDSGEKNLYTFERFEAVKDQGSKCRPIFAR